MIGEDRPGAGESGENYGEKKPVRLGLLAKVILALGPEFLWMIGILVVIAGVGYYAFNYLPKDLGAMLSSAPENAVAGDTNSGGVRSVGSYSPECQQFRQNILGHANELNKEGLRPEEYKLQLEAFALRNGYSCPLGGDFDYRVTPQGDRFSLEIACSQCQPGAAP